MKFFRLMMASAMENMIILVLTVFQHKLQRHVSAREQTNMEYTTLFTVAYQYLTESDKSPTIIVSIYTLKQTLSVKNKVQNKIWNTMVFSKPSTRIQLFVCTLHFFCESDIYYTYTYVYKYIDTFGIIQHHILALKFNSFLICTKCFFVVAVLFCFLSEQVK